MTTMTFMVFICAAVQFNGGVHLECDQYRPNQTMYRTAEQCKAAIEADPIIPQVSNRIFKCMGKPVSSWQPVE